MPLRTTQKTRERRRHKGATHTVAIVGLGYVGLPLALACERAGYSVRGYDIDKDKVARLRKRETDLLSPSEAAYFSESELDADWDESVLAGARIYVVCVPTPVHGNRLPNLTPLREACAAIGRHLQEGSLVIIESTVSPGVCEGVARKELERSSGLTAGKDFSFAHCPERVNPGDPAWDVRTIPRVVGGLDRTSLARAVRFYEAVIDAPLRAMDSIQEAEAVKMVENAFRDVNIAFVNELAMSFARANIDVVNVLDGAATKPFGFLPHYPGCGVGGHCIPVDPYYLIRYGKRNGFEHRFLATARNINNGMPRYTVDLLRAALEERGKVLAGAPVALLGLSYKRDVGDLRESPALAIRAELLRAGAQVRTFDPLLPKESTADSLHEALSGAHAAVLATDHALFRELTPQAFMRYGVGAVIDGRNCLDKREFASYGITYKGIGR